MKLKIKHPTLWLESKPKLAWTLVAVYATIIFILSSFPYAPPEPGFLARVSSTFKHIFEYFIFGFLLLAAFRSNTKTRKSALLLAFIFASFYGLSDEFHQLFVPGRTASIIDSLADSLGSFLGAFISKPGIFSGIFKRLKNQK